MEASYCDVFISGDNRLIKNVPQNKEAYADHRKSVNLDPRIPRSWGRYPPVESMRGMGLIVLIGIALVLIFRLKLRPPDKEK